MKNTLIKDAIVAAGGRSHVARELGLSHEGIRRWSVYGLPPSEWTPKATYLSQIETLQLKRHGKVLVTAEQIKAAQVWD